jgi:uncharacterized protein YggU (UPF0235/DUF167 family)
MKIFVKVKTGSRENKISPPKAKLWNDDQYSDGRVMDYYVVCVKELPIDGKANDAVILLLAQYFRVSRANVVIKSGSTSRTKIFEIG